MDKPNPLFLSTAIEAVVRAGELQIAKFGTNVRVEMKGAIDLVTEVDLEVERMFRALIAERFPDHDVLAEELDVASRGARARIAPRSARPVTPSGQLAPPVFDPELLWMLCHNATAFSERRSSFFSLALVACMIASIWPVSFLKPYGER